MSKSVFSDVFRLAKPKPKGILALIFSRFLLIATLIVLQLLVFLVFFAWLYNYLPHFIIVERVVAVIMITYLFSNSMDPSAKMTWMFVMILVPFAGSLLLLFTQTNAGHRKVKKRVEALVEETRDAILQDPDVEKTLYEEGGDTEDLVHYLNRSGCFPAYGGTESRFFSSGEEKLEVLLEELQKAEEFIFLEYFIIEEGYMWGRILEILVEKVAAGVEVRVMYDGMCEMSTLPVNYKTLLRNKGIKAKSFSPIRPILSSHYNYRDHRKILVIDGKVAFTGGVNLADEYVNRVERFGHWKDTALMLKGPAVKSFTLLFLQMWNITEKEAEFRPWLRDTDYVPEHPDGFVVPFGDCPLDGDKVGEAVYMDILNRAGSYVHIMTPYLVLDGVMETALRYAAERGIDVSIILPGIPDKKMPYALAKSHYKALLEAGVKIYEYTPGFVHAKICVSDDKKAVVGTINLDYRSLYHHFECAAYLYKTESVMDIERDFQETLAKCRVVTRESVRQESKFYKVLGTVLKFIAPLM